MVKAESDLASFWEMTRDQAQHTITNRPSS